jgi:serine phosphatase RsbU (regulator of sigma subunit)
MIGLSEILSAPILVVDDKQANVKLLESMLRFAGYTAVHSTTDPREVYELHRRHRYGLILLDLQMPEMDGFQVMEGLKEIEEDGYLPVLITTAHPDQKLRALKAGARDFVSKPFDLAELRARLHNILEVRLLHLEAKTSSKALEDMVRQLEGSQQRELALTLETQRGLVPRFLVQLGNYKIHAFNNPTRHLGGNFYDILQRSSGDCIGVLADFSGKGMPSALLGAMVLGALRTEFRSGTELQQIPARLDDLLHEKAPDLCFDTLFLFTLGRDGVGQFISVGKNPVHVYRATSRRIERLEPDVPVHGEECNFASSPARCFQLGKGDILVVASDGFAEAENPHKEVFGEERLCQTIQRNAHLGSHAVEQSLLKAIQDFTLGMPQTDDITFLIVEKSY